MLSLHTKKRTHQIHLPKTATAEAFSLLPFCYIHFLRVGFTLTSGLIVPSIAPFPSSEFCMFSRIRTNSRPEVFPGTASGKTLSQSDFTLRAQAVCSPMRLRRASWGASPASWRSSTLHAPQAYFIFLAAASAVAASVVVATAVAAEEVISAAAEEDQENDDPSAAVTAEKSVVASHN